MIRAHLARTLALDKNERNKARQVVAASDKNALDYVTRRFNASSAGLKKLVELDLR
jgi:hypothetical protein